MRTTREDVAQHWEAARDHFGLDQSFQYSVRDQTRYVHEYQRAMKLAGAAPAMLNALRVAESFIVGFEGDEVQEGIDELLGEIRAAIAEAEAS